jgi:hypothetical protein
MTKNPDRDARILELFRQGLSMATVAERLFGDYPGLSRSTVAAVIHRARARGENMIPSALSGRSSATIRQKSQNCPELAASAAPPLSAVPLDERAGCAWPYGDSCAGGLRYCNATCCVVQSPYGKARKVAYCAEHWWARHRTHVTRVVG